MEALAADDAARAQMSDFLVQKYGLDKETIANVRDGEAKSFLMPVIPPGVEGSGICLASRPWLSFCGFSESEVIWKQPKDLLPFAFYKAL